MLEKIAMRLEASSQTEALSASYIRDCDDKILQSILALPEFIAAPRIFAYCSIGREIDTRKLINHCLIVSKPIALPTNLSKGQMDFALIDSPVSQLPKGVFGIPEPPPNAPIVTPGPSDLVLVPALCFDTEGYRLGRGGGYYDRFLAKSPAISLGLCREAMLVPAVPRQPCDLPVKLLLSDLKLRGPKTPQPE